MAEKKATETTDTFTDWHLEKVVGLRFLLAISTSEHILRGFNEVACDTLGKFMFAEYNLPATTLTICIKLTNLPWCLKCLYGLMSDVFPIFGYRKMPYMAAVSVIGSACAFILGMTSTASRSVTFSILLLIGVKQQVSVCDLLTKAAYSERLRKYPEIGPDLVTFLWLGLVVTSIVTTGLIGEELQSDMIAPVFLACAVVALTALYPIFSNYLAEQSVGGESGLRRSRLLSDTEVIVPTVVVTLVCFTLLGLSLHRAWHSSPLSQLFYPSVACLFILIACFLTFIRRPVAVAVVFMLLVNIHVDYTGASFYFYTDTAEAYPDGPHFSALFFVTMTGWLKDGVQIVVLLIYRWYFKEAGYKPLFYAAVALDALAYSLDIIMFSRTNLALGIPDHFFLLGSSGIKECVNMLFIMPMLCLLSQLCPRGKEASIFAILVSGKHMAGLFSGILGAFVLDKYGVEPTGQLGDEEQLKSLWHIPFLAMCWGFLCLPLIHFCIPDARLTDKVEIGENDSGSEEAVVSA